jgi:capsular exopolysaccharide synthesis family protein
MSRNFELIRETEKVRDTNPNPGYRPAGMPGNGNGNGHHSGAVLDLDKVAREESLKLVQRVFLLQAGEPPHTVAFAGVDHGNGCSRTCVSVAQILAEKVPGTVCVVDANLRSPSLPRYFNVANHHGLTDALLGDEPIRNYAQQLRPENLWLITCGSLATDSPNLLSSDRLKKRLAELREEFDFVLIDAPPLRQYADAIAVGQLAEGLVLVLEANSTRRESALEVINSLRSAQVQVLGAVLNKRTFPIPESLYHRF